MKNVFGNVLQMTSFGESHGAGLGVVVDGCPAGLDFDLVFLQSELARRRPGQSEITTSRNEADQVEILSGVFAGKTLGTPITMLVRNTDARSEDYSAIKSNPRPGHADDVWLNKFQHSDLRGGGRSSGRETISRVMAGAVAQMILKKLIPNLKIRAFAEQIGHYKISQEEKNQFLKSPKNASDFTAGFIGAKHAELKDFLLKAKDQGESYGGKIGICIENMPSGLGQPVFHKLKADLTSAIMSIGSVVGVGLSGQEEALSLKGTEFHKLQKYGGIRGGISTGENIELSAVLKPTSSILDIAKKGRHDPCIIPRAIPVFDNMVAFVICDHLLWARLDRV